jgi:hypothetical protein
MSMRLWFLTLLFTFCLLPVRPATAAVVMPEGHCHGMPRQSVANLQHRSTTTTPCQPSPGQTPQQFCTCILHCAIPLSSQLTLPEPSIWPARWERPSLPLYAGITVSPLLRPPVKA